MNGREEKPFLLIKVCPFTSLLSLSLSFISIWSYFLCLGLPKHCFSVVLLFQPHGCVSVKLLRLQPKTLNGYSTANDPALSIDVSRTRKNISAFLLISWMLKERKK